MGRNKLVQRAESATAACLGREIPTEHAPEILSFIESLPDHQQSRTESSLSEGASVYPEAKGLYKVYSDSNREVEEESPLYDSDFYRVDVLHESRCECADYMFRCDPEKGQQCKHLWRVRFLSRVGALPGQSEEPIEWMVSTLETDIELAREFGANRTAERLESLKSHTNKLTPREVNFKAICTSRMRLLNETVESEEAALA